MKKEFTLSPFLWAVICVQDNKNIKDASKEIGWDISDTGL